MNHDELQALIKRMRENTELNFDETVEMLNQGADELEAILDLLAKQQKIIRRIYVEHFPDTYFVCGESGNKDQNGLPDRIEVCPAYGVDWSQIYERTDRQIGGMGS
jgi:hypothetical protein